MNQILNTKIDIENTGSLTRKKNIFYFKWQFFISFIALIICISYFIYKNQNKKDDLSTQLIDNLYISSLYNSDVQRVILDNTYTANEEVFSVIGIITINSIKLNYPILSKISDDLLKIAPCKFFGPEPNEIGNFCIAAHNYNNSSFFSKISTLKNDDIITIYNNLGEKQDYLVYNNYEVENQDTNCTSQDTNGKKEITLITCNNSNSKRIIVKAKEKE